ncbi:hypothetical protein GQ44DRAFT_777036 [Phaeosphaeriaceae sp. PMI808]|nr:hypothetical protein GQ44DRAFT_777036 [Phaeosphaeriaceae sp. PMI808]
MNIQSAASVPLPFQYYTFEQNRDLFTLTWEECFSFSKDDIRRRFVTPLRDAPKHRTQFTESVKERADMLTYMLICPTGSPDSLVISKAIQDALEAVPPMPGAINNHVAKVKLLQTMNPDVPNDSGLGYIEWDPIRRRRGVLQCYTVFDLLSSCMSAAATAHDSYQLPFTFFERLLSLFAHWCRIIRPNIDHHPATVGIMNVSNTIVLGATVPGVPGNPNAKEYIRETRAMILGKQSLWEGRAGHKFLICEEAGTMEGRQKYGHCAETSFFSLLCMMDKDDRVKARGLAMSTPKTVFESEASEKARHKIMCDNCHRMAKLCIEDDAGRNGRTVRNIASSWWSSEMSLQTYPKTHQSTAQS